MGLLDFIFGKDPEWVEVTKDIFSIEGTYVYSKPEEIKLLIMANLKSSRRLLSSADKYQHNTHHHIDPRKHILQW